MKTPKCPVVFSAAQVRDAETVSECLQRSGGMTFHELLARHLTVLAAAQWQAYVEGLQEVVSSQSEKGTRIWWAKDLWQKIYRKPHTHVTRILPPEEL